MQDKTSTISTNIPCGLYVLKHKDFDVAMLISIFIRKNTIYIRRVPSGRITNWMQPLGKTLLEGLELL